MSTPVKFKYAIVQHEYVTNQYISVMFPMVIEQTVINQPDTLGFVQYIVINDLLSLFGYTL